MDQEEYRIKRLDVWSKILLGIVGIVVSLLLGFSQFKIQEKQQQLTVIEKAANERAKQESLRNEMLDIVNQNLPYFLDDNKRGEISRSIIVKLAIKLSEDFEFPHIAEITSPIYDIDSSNNSLNNANKFRLAEAIQRPAQKTNWFCVIASYHPHNLDDAENLVRNFNLKRIEVDGIKYGLSMYRTVVSNHIAVTLGKELSKNDATMFKRLAVEKKWSLDAFVQINRNWELLES